MTRSTLLNIIAAGALACGMAAIPAGAQESRTVVFAGGCFWSVEKTFDSVAGVTETVSGFSGGHVANPTYYQVVAGGTGHVESVQVTFDPARVSYDELLDVYWHSIDPTDATGQFCDKGDHYESVVFVGDGAERAAAQASRDEVAGELGTPVATRIEAAQPFYAAGPEHQNFHQTNPAHYERYRIGCGRDRALAAVWGEKAYRTAAHQG